MGNTLLAYDSWFYVTFKVEIYYLELNFLVKILKSTLFLPISFQFQFHWGKKCMWAYMHQPLTVPDFWPNNDLFSYDYQQFLHLTQCNCPFPIYGVYFHFFGGSSGVASLTIHPPPPGSAPDMPKSKSMYPLMGWKGLASTERLQLLEAHLLMHNLTLAWCYSGLLD